MSFTSTLAYLAIGYATRAAKPQVAASRQLFFETRHVIRRALYRIARSRLQTPLQTPSCDFGLAK